MTDHTDIRAENERRLLVVTIDDERARIRDFDLHSRTVSDSERRVRNDDPWARNLRTVERRLGHDDVQDLVPFFEETARVLQDEYLGRRFVLFGHGDGKSDAAAMFLERLRDHHPLVADAVIAQRRIDLSAATDADLVEAAVSVAEG